MARASYSVEIAESAFNDLNPIIDYWVSRHEAQRGYKHAVDLVEAASKLSNPEIADAGKKAADQTREDIKEIGIFQDSYKVIYMIVKLGGGNAAVKILALRKV